MGNKIRILERKSPSEPAEILWQNGRGKKAIMLNIFMVFEDNGRDG